MVLYRFNHLSQTLKSTSAGLFNVSLSQTASGTPKYVYKPMLYAPRSAVNVVSNQSSDHGHGQAHDPGYYVSTKFKGWENWKTWKDVPDELIPKSSWRDPDNPIYAHPTYIKFRKQQLFYQRPCGLPVYLRSTGDRYMYYFCVIGVICCLARSYYDMYQIIYKDVYPDSNLFYFF
jgi:hypothetical protein